MLKSLLSKIAEFNHYSLQPENAGRYAGFSALLLLPYLYWAIIIQPDLHIPLFVLIFFMIITAFLFGVLLHAALMLSIHGKRAITRLMGVGLFLLCVFLPLLAISRD